MKTRLPGSNVGFVELILESFSSTWAPRPRQPTQSHRQKKAARAEGLAARPLYAPPGRRIAQGGYTRLPSIPRDSRVRGVRRPRLTHPLPRPVPAQVFFFWHSRRPDATPRAGAAGAGHGAGSSRTTATPCLPMSVPGPSAAAPAGDAGAPGAPGVGKAARVNGDARLALAGAFVGLWMERDLEGARGVWVTDFPALAKRATQESGKTVSAAVAEAWCAKVLPKQDKQSTMSLKRKTTIAAAWTAAGAPGVKPPLDVLVRLLAEPPDVAVPPDAVERHWAALGSGTAQVPAQAPVEVDAVAPRGAGGHGTVGTRRARPVARAAGATDLGYERAWDADVETWCADRLLARKGMNRFVGSRAFAAVAGGGVVGASLRVSALVDSMFSVDAMAATPVDLMATLKPVHGSYQVRDVPAHRKLPQDPARDSLYLDIRVCSVSEKGEHGEPLQPAEPVLLCLKVQSFKGRVVQQDVVAEFGEQALAASCLRRLQERAVRETARTVVYLEAPRHENLFAFISGDDDGEAYTRSERGICSIVAQKLHLPNSTFPEFPHWAWTIVVGRCRLTISISALKAPMVSALEATT